MSNLTRPTPSVRTSAVLFKMHFVTSFDKLEVIVQPVLGIYILRKGAGIVLLFWDVQKSLFS